MQDFIAMGNGNSRFLKSVENFLELYPSYEDFAAALIAGTFPVDFNGYNPEGVAQYGTDLLKANLLADATAAAVNSAAGTKPNTPNEAFEALAKGISNLFSNSIVVSTYIGTGTTSQKIALPFTPRAVFVCDMFGRTWFLSGTGTITSMAAFGGLAVTDNPNMAYYAYTSGPGSSTVSPKTNVEIVDNGFNVYYSSSTNQNANVSSDYLVYYYIAIA